jgi:methyltransferase (TIGR00027 family)
VNPTPEPLLRNISDTARWAATFRARETEREDALFRDPYAKPLGGLRGEQITDSLEHADQHSWAWVMRTYLFDRFITAQVNGSVDLVLNLAAGLDARPYRMPLPQNLRWIEVDLPALLAYKQEILADEKPTCALERVSLDLSDIEKRHNLFTKLASGARKVLVLSEGLLVYLTPDENGALARDLAAQPTFAHWLFDLPSPPLLEMLRQTVGPHTEKAGAPLKFGPPEGPEFFEPFGWTPLQTESVFKAAVETNRVPKELEAFREFQEPPKPWTLPMPWSGVCLMQRKAA